MCVIDNYKCRVDPLSWNKQERRIQASWRLEKILELPVRKISNSTIGSCNQHHYCQDLHLPMRLLRFFSIQAPNFLNRYQYAGTKFCISLNSTSPAKFNTCRIDTGDGVLNKYGPVTVDWPRIASQATMPPENSSSVQKLWWSTSSSSNKVQDEGWYFLPWVQVRHDLLWNKDTDHVTPLSLSCYLFYSLQDWWRVAKAGNPWLTTHCLTNVQHMEMATVAIMFWAFAEALYSCSFTKNGHSFAGMSFFDLSSRLSFRSTAQGIPTSTPRS